MWNLCTYLECSFVDATSTLEYSAALCCCNYNALESEVADDVSTVIIPLSYCKSGENILGAIINQVERESECERVRMNCVGTYAMFRSFSSSQTHKLQATQINSVTPLLLRHTLALSLRRLVLTHTHTLTSSPAE